MKTRNITGGYILVFGIIASFSAASAHAQTVARSPAGYFEFHVDPWISLHHFAYHFVREEERNLKLRGRVPLTGDDRMALTPEMRAACAPVKQAYRPYIEGDLRSDAKTRGLAKALVDGVHAVADDAVRAALTNPVEALRHE